MPRIKDLTTTATSPESGDFVPVDGGTGTRKMAPGAMRQVSETFASITPSSGVLTVDLSAGTVFNASLTGNVSSFTVSNAIASRANAFTLILAQDGTGGRTVSFTFTGKTLKWPSAVAPSISTAANKVDVYSFVSADGGSTWLGFVGGQNY